MKTRALAAWLCLFALSGAAAEPARQKVIIDCDLAGDIDDAFAVALALTSPELDVLGLVMAHGNTAKRAQVACRLLYETGMEIPVVVGRATPLVVGHDTGIAGDAEQFVWGKDFARVQPIAQNAAEFIIENLRRFPGEVVLLTVGPVCNIQDVLERDPDALKLARRIVSMFGSFHLGYGSNPTPSAEWNVRADAHAAQLFVASGARLVFAGLDVTTFVKLDEANRTRLLFRNSPLTDALCGLYALWRFEDYSQPDPVLYDAVALGMVLWPELFSTRPAHVRVTDDGFTVVDENAPPNCEIAMSINTEEFIRRIMTRLLKQNLMRSDDPRRVQPAA